LVALLVGGAILLTGLVLSREPGGTDVTATTSPVEVDSDVVLACPAALEAACGSAAQTLGVGFEVWRSGDPLPERGVVLAPARSFPDGTELGPLVAESPVVIAGWRTRWQPIELFCDGVDADCVASSLGQPWVELGGSSSWGDFKIGLTDPTGSEAGMLAWSVLEPALGADGEAFSSSLRVVAPSDAALMEELVLFSSRADLVVTTEVAVAGQFQNAIDRQAGRFEIGYPESGPWIEYVAVGSGRGSDSLIEQLSGDEVAAVFTGAGLRPATGVVGALPDGLGDPGTKSPSPDDATRGTLTSAWEEYR
jgi:hypothetical protein